MNVISNVALGKYVLQEVFAALLIFSILFAIAASIALALYLIDRAGRRAMEWAEPRTMQAVSAARGRLERSVDDFGKGRLIPFGKASGKETHPLQENR